MLNILLWWQIPCIPEIHCCRGEPATTIDMRVKQLNQTLRDCDSIIWGGLFLEFFVRFLDALASLDFKLSVSQSVTFFYS